MLLSRRKNGTLPFVAPRMDIEIIILNEVGQGEKDKYCMIHLYVESKYGTMNLWIYKTEIDSQT